MSSQNFSAAGAVDLSALAARAKASAESAGGSGTNLVIDVSEQNFENEVLQQSMSVPVVIDFWADWCQPCKQLSPILERLAAEYGGKFILAKVDTEANQRLTAAAQVQSLPTVVGVLKGQVVPLFTGALPEAEVTRYLDELLRVAEANGVTGTVEPVADQAAEAEDAGPDPRYAAAEEALANDDLDGAIAAYQAVLANAPGDEGATAGMAKAKLLQRVKGADVDAVRTAAANAPTDVDAQCNAADLEVYGGNVVDGFDRLVATVKRTSGDERERARQHLLELFNAVGVKDPRVAKARQSLASALF